MSACPDVSAIAAFAEGRGAPTVDFEAHLDACARCRTLVAIACGASTVPAAAPPPSGSDGTEPGLAAEVSAPTTLDLPPELEGRYAALGPCGRGGQSQVLMALDQHLGRYIALKELLPRAGDAAGRHLLAARFLHEARITAYLQHPSIVPLYELGRRGDGTPYYTMQLVRGRTLARALADAPTLAARRGLLPHLLSACEAIAYAHSRGIVHRDIKPQNIMIGEFGETIVLDWGLAKMTSAAARDPAAAPWLMRDPTVATMYGSPVGTPAYMSPEQAHGRLDEIDERTDVWGLGALLYHLLAGQPPFLGASPPEMLARARGGTFRPIREAAPDAPAALAAVVERALSPSQEDRYPDARALARDLAAYLTAERSEPARPTGLTVSRLAALVIALVALALLLGALVGGFLWGRAAGPP